MFDTDNTMRIVYDIYDIIDDLYEIGDKDECSEKNLIYGLCSILFYNDLAHLMDYSSNGHSDKDTKKFIKLWNEILDLVKDLEDEQRELIIKNLLFEYKDSYILDYYMYKTPKNVRFMGLDSQNVNRYPTNSLLLINECKV